MDVWNTGCRETGINHFTGGETMDTALERGYVKYAWIIFFGFGFLTVIAAPINLSGRPPNPLSPHGMTGLTLDQIDTHNHRTRRNLI